MASAQPICPCCHRPLDPAARVFVSLDMNTVSFRDQMVRLTPREAEVLFVLAQAMPGAARMDAIVADVWSNQETDGDVTCNFRVVLARLRRRILPMGLKIMATGRRQYMLADWITPTLKASRAAA